MTVVFYSDSKTTAAPVNIDAEWREAISDANVDKINARTKSDR